MLHLVIHEPDIVNHGLDDFTAPVNGSPLTVLGFEVEEVAVSGELSEPESLSSRKN